jgi:hypothetical protein
VRPPDGREARLIRTRGASVQIATTGAERLDVVGRLVGPGPGRIAEDPGDPDQDQEDSE